VELVFEISGNQIDGARDYQEDAFLVTYLDDDEGGDGKSSALVIMADGMGGHAAGNIASNLVVSTFNKAFSGSFGKDTPPEVLRVALAKANGALTESIRETPALDGMGCTMVTAMFSKGKVYWISVGDSHLYLIRDRELIKKNEDHSYGGYLDRMKEQGLEVEAESGLSRNMLMSAMTGDEIAEVDCVDDGVQLLPGDRLIVCSDGLDTLSAGVIIQTSAWSPTAKECVAAMLKAIEDANKPRQDNTTVVVVDVFEKAGSAAPVAAPAPPAAASDPEDVTTRTGDTQELSVDEIEDAISQHTSEGSSGGGKGIIIAIAAIVLLAVLGAAVYFFMSYNASQGTDDASAPTANIEQRAEPEATQSVVSKSPDAPRISESVTASQPTPTPAPAPEIVAAGMRVFSDPLSNGDGPMMVMLPGGNFFMGAKAFAGDGSELPRHERQIAPFAISQSEITIAQYQEFTDATKRKMPNLSGLDAQTYPVVFVSWDDANAYVRWLSKESGHKYQLPSEAQWEYAARAGTQSAFWWGNDVGVERAHCFDCKTGLNPRQPTKVRRFEPNAFELYDTAGNVMEWTRDCYHKNYNGAPHDSSVWEGGDCNVRVARGGAYGNTGKSLRSAARARRPAKKGNDETGIRVIRAP
jgi:formylglycine-generating enzyme required for sulfatase activity/serine/threonine protein phosphatase PrpC